MLKILCLPKVVENYEKEFLVAYYSRIASNEQGFAQVRY
jgi:hypothetical protein